MTDADFSQKPTLYGEQVTLTPLTEEHFPVLWEDFIGDPESMRLTGTRGEFDADAVRKLIAGRVETVDRLDFAVVDNASGACVGEAVLNNWDPPNRNCSFRIAIFAAGRDRGLGTEATRLTVGHAFDALGLHRVSLTVFAFNPRAQRVYEKVGFVREGVQRDQLLWDGQWVDSVQMSILEDEWARHRGRPETVDS